MKKSFIFFAALFPLCAKAANVTVVSVSLNQNIEAPRWMFDGKTKVKGGRLIELMVEAKRAQAKSDRLKCLTNIEQAYKLGKSLGPWIAVNQVQCAMMRDKVGKVLVGPLQQALALIEAQPRWLLFGPSVGELRKAYVQGLLVLSEAQLKGDRKAAWKTLDRLHQIKSWLSTDERAGAFRFAGELAFIEQNLAAAQDFLVRSLDERENAELRSRLESIRSSLLGKKSTPVEKQSDVVASDDLGLSDDEKEIYSRMIRAYESQDYVSALEDGVQLIQKFPGGKRAGEASDRVLEIYLSLSSRTDEKFRHVRESMVKEMGKADGGRVARWANNAFARGNYIDALNLAEQSYEKLNGHPDATKVLLLAGEAAVASGEYSDARELFEKLLRLHAGTIEAAEGNFRLGLLEYRLKRYPQAAAFFERLLALSAGRDFEYRALYWQWRTQQKVDPVRAEVTARNLITKYPISYYGLRAKAELNGGVLQLGNKVVNVKAEMRLLESERLAWERFLILLKAGWFKEAERELDSLPDPQSNEERLVRAKYWAATFRYDLAMQVMNQVFENDPNLLQAPVLKIIFPDEYLPSVSREAKSTGIAPEWIFSVIRQESSFRYDVKSPANAVGLMQLLPTTAAELARDHRLKDYGVESLIDPEVNIKLGSIYLARLTKTFNGNVPLALAAYNTGQGRMRRWLSSRRDFGPLENSRTSAPEVEVWMDEMPWDETSFYVKAILRNWMIYKLLDGSKVSLSEPIWVDAKP